MSSEKARAVMPSSADVACAAKPAAPTHKRLEHTGSRIAGRPTQYRKVGQLPCCYAAQVALKPRRRCTGLGVRRQRLGGRERFSGRPGAVAAARRGAVHRGMQGA